MPNTMEIIYTSEAYAMPDFAVNTLIDGMVYALLKEGDDKLTISASTSNVIAEVLVRIAEGRIPHDRITITSVVDGERITQKIDSEGHAIGGDTYWNRDALKIQERYYDVIYRNTGYRYHWVIKDWTPELGYYPNVIKPIG